MSMIEADVLMLLFSVSIRFNVVESFFAFRTKAIFTILFDYLMFPFSDDFTKIVFKKVPFNYS